MNTIHSSNDPKYGITAQTVDSVFPGLIITGNMGIGTGYYSDSPTKSDHEMLLKRIEEIEKRLFILQPNQELQDKYPGLKEAYEAYRIIEKMVK